MFFGFYIKYSDLFGKKPTIREAVRKINNFGLLNAINLLSRIDLTLGYGYNDILQAQIPLLTKKFACANVAAKVMQYFNKKRTDILASQYLLFHPHQILNAVKLCLQYCKMLRKETDIPPLESLIEALLMINEYLIPEDLENKLGKKETELIRYVMMNALFHRLEAEKNTIGRWKELIFETYRMIDKSDPDYIDAFSLFKSTYGMTPQEYFACCFGLYSFWRSLPEAKIDQGILALGSDSQAKNFLMDTDIYNKVVAEISAPLEWYRLEFKKQKKFIPYEFLPIQKKPILAHVKHLYCLSKKLLLEKMTSGIYHMFFNCFEDDDSKYKFFRFMGKVYQQYLINILEKEFNNPLIAMRFFRPTQYKDRHQLIESSDGIIDYGDKLMVLEFKSHLFTHEFLTHGTIEEFKLKLKDIIFDGAEQIDRTINHFKNGLLTIDGVERKRIKRFYPVIISLQPIPMEKYLYKYIQNELQAKRLLNTQDIEQIEIISTYGLETTLSIMNTGKSFVDLINEKHMTDTDTMSSIENYLISRYPDISKAPHYIDVAFHEAIDQIHHFWKTRNSDQVEKTYS